MSTPNDNTKSVRISPELHARLATLQDSLPGCTTMARAIEFLMSPACVRVAVTPAQHSRWRAVAQSYGQNVGDFITARVEAAITYGADAGALRRVHDMVYALTKAAGIAPVPPQPESRRNT